MGSEVIGIGDDLVLYQGEGGAEMMGSKAFESPLISHARMRALYRALVESRVLSQRAVTMRAKAETWPRGLEACWVGTAIDLKDGDFTSVARGEWLLEHVLRVGRREGARAATKPDVARSLRGLAEAKRAELPAFDRMLCSVGMAMTLKAQGNGGVAMAYVGADALTAAEWKRLLTAAGDDALPLVFVVTPAAGSVDLSAIAARIAAHHVPVIPVDAGDAVALYRVAQETLVRARADGGVAVIECVDCDVEPLAMLGRQLVSRKICTGRWVDAVEQTFRRTVSGA